MDEGHDTVDGGVFSKPPMNQRTIQLNQPQAVKYRNNEISTAKYNVFTFIPKFFFEQFRRYSNVFFLFIALMQQIPNVSPTGRFTTLVPLILIFCVSSIKEIVEDIKRHAVDDEVNKRKVFVLREFNWIHLPWSEVKVGDFVKVVNGHFFPADLVLLSSSEPQGMCYIETSNLDGETNLKIRQGLPQTSSMLTKEDLQKVKGAVECELPNRHIYDFVGNLRIEGQLAWPLGPSQLLLRGAYLKNTRWIFGVAVYTGHESKIMLNSTSAPLKRPTVELVVNRQTVMLFVVLLFIALFSAAASEIWSRLQGVNHWYLNIGRISPGNFFYNLLTFVILYNNLVPISLQVTLEIVKFVQAIFINWDRDMYDEESDTPAVARTSNLNEELGQVKYIFSDKTGTLTRNIMEFRKCSIAGVVYGDNQEETDRFADQTLEENLLGGHPTAPIIREFLTVLAVCHTVIPEKDLDDPKEISYQASSPDERALVLGAKSLGFTFHTRLPESVVINALGVDETYDILHVLEFTSDRKRMSVIVRMPDGTIKLMTKGADTVIYERLSNNNSQKAITLQHLEDFAKIGLRTLCIATAVIPSDEYDAWKKIYYEASTSIIGREELLADAAELIEKKLHLLGATAIEDKLQDGIAESIENLSKAGIKIWVLTGDKQETAINIGYSSRLLTPEMEVLLINAYTHEAMKETLDSQLIELDSTGRKDHSNIGLIIDGESLKFALLPELRQAFLDIAVSCKAVICCRVSPLQKAEIVELVRKGVNAITLAIGDGANDVGMIQKAHVGIGISGVEGLQAACASDYSIAQFRYLNKLLLVHGAWSYHRLTKLILYSFYKNICLYVIEFWFAILSGFSGQVVFERWTIGLYNVLFTAAPPMAIGLFDRYCSAESMLQFPALYKSSQSSALFNVKIFWLWCLNAIYHSALLFWLTVLILYQDIAFQDGKVGDYLFLGNMVYTYVVITVCVKAGLETSSWTIFTHISTWGSILCWFIFLAFYPMVWSFVNLAPEMVGMNRYVYSCPIFWLGMFVIPLASLLRDICWKVLRRTVMRTFREDVLEMEQASKEPKYVALHTTKRRMVETARLLRNAFTRSGQIPAEPSPSELQTHGYAFSQEENGFISQSDLIRHYDTTLVKPGGL